MDVLKIVQGATTEGDYRKFLLDLRWSDGFICPRCDNNKGYFIKKRSSYECSSCKLQSTATSRTVLHGTRNVKAWIKGIESITSGSNLPATRFSKQENLSYGAAWLILHRIRYLLFELSLASPVREMISVSFFRNALFKSSSEPEFAPMEDDEVDGNTQAYAGQFVTFLLVVFHGVSRKYVQLYLSEFSYTQGKASTRLIKMLRCLVRGSPINENKIKSYVSPDTVLYCA